jgi:signal transduction histidine kinase/DNA-binding response OmpR family regulator
MSRAQILIVEDDSVVAQDMKERLVEQGYAVPAVACSGEEAIEKAVEIQPDLVLMDIVLAGGMDGIEASRRIHERLSVPIVYLSAYADEDTVARAKETSPCAYLVKPYNDRELYTTVEVTLEKHRQEDRVKQGRGWLAAILGCVGDAVIATDSRGFVKFLNAAAERLIGRTAEEVVNQYLPDACAITAPERGNLFESLSEVRLRPGAALSLPPGSVLTARTGKQTAIAGGVAALFDQEGTFAGFVLAFREASAQAGDVPSAGQLADKTQTPEWIPRAMIHDCNNLLCAMLGNLSLLREGLSADDANGELAAATEQAGVRASELLNQLLGRVRRPAQSWQPVDLNGAVAEALDQVRGSLGQQIQVHFSLLPEVWPVRADWQQLLDVLTNLFLNARDAMPAGGRLTVETGHVVMSPEGVTLHPGARQGEFVCVRVRDEGEGVAPEIRPYIFEPFFTTKKAGQGTGLGLARVKRIVEQHGGWIECHSVADRGTRFDLYLPRLHRQPVQAEALPGVTPPPTILLADDEAFVRKLGGMVLQHCGYRVLVARDGKEAVAICQREQDNIDLVVLNLGLPQFSSEETLHQLLAVNKRLRILLVSGYLGEELRPQENDRIVGVIGEPHRLQDFAEQVRGVLQHKVPCAVTVTGD